MQDQLNIHEALKAAVLRKVERLHRMQCEIAELNYTGFITPTELWLLESTGYTLDFDSGLCTDTWQPQNAVALAQDDALPPHAVDEVRT